MIAVSVEGSSSPSREPLIVCGSWTAGMAVVVHLTGLMVSTQETLLVESALIDCMGEHPRDAWKSAVMLEFTRKRT